MTQAATYEDAVSEVWGPFMRICVELCIFFYCFGASIAYLAVIGDQISDCTCNRSALLSMVQSDWLFKSHDKNMEFGWLYIKLHALPPGCQAI